MHYFGGWHVSGDFCCAFFGLCSISLWPRNLANSPEKPCRAQHRQDAPYSRENMPPRCVRAFHKSWQLWFERYLALDTTSFVTTAEFRTKTGLQGLLRRAAQIFAFMVFGVSFRSFRTVIPFIYFNIWCFFYKAVMFCPARPNDSLCKLRIFQRSPDGKIVATCFLKDIHLLKRVSNKQWWLEETPLATGSCSIPLSAYDLTRRSSFCLTKICLSSPVRTEWPFSGIKAGRLGKEDNDAGKDELHLYREPKAKSFTLKAVLYSW